MRHVFKNWICVRSLSELDVLECVILLSIGWHSDGNMH